MGLGSSQRGIRVIRVRVTGILLYFAVTFLSPFFRFHAKGALPNYIPNLRSGNGNREALIEDYFCLGFFQLLGSALISAGISWHSIKFKASQKDPEQSWTTQEKYPFKYQESRGCSRARITMKPNVFEMLQRHLTHVYSFLKSIIQQIQTKIVRHIETYSTFCITSHQSPQCRRESESYNS